ncbi:gephyrin-like molybdotransferase Glp [Marinicella sp. W31]|uniref:molybdopterin molybdotransferase MoeA n=1 Tax=Marinicella sp. W31 TaxID=3023713 RepID=UPI003757393A
MNAAKPGVDLMPVEQALSRLLSDVQAVKGFETVRLQQALGRFLAEDQISDINVPGFTNSAMDGYALDIDKLPANRTLPLVQRCAAGDTAVIRLAENSCARIFTGAAVPIGANAVVMQEQCEIQEKENGYCVVFPEIIEREQNIRRVGLDIEQGQTVLKAGRQLRPQDLALLSSVGIYKAPVKRKLKVAILANGDELIEPGQKLSFGQIYNSNHMMLMQLLEKQGFSSCDAGTVADDPQHIRDALLKAAQEADCIISCGGVSVGEEDHVKSVVAELGSIDLWRIAIKPGKPFAFGSVQGVPFLGLPGNPSSAFVTFHVIALPFLLALQTGREHLPTGIPVRIDFTHKTTIREQFLYVRLDHESDGRAYLSAFPQQNSGVLSGSAWASGLARVPPEKQVRPGDKLIYYPFA